MPHKPKQEKGDENSPEKILGDSIDDLALAFSVLAKKAKGLKSATEVFQLLSQAALLLFQQLTLFCRIDIKAAREYFRNSSVLPVPRFLSRSVSSTLEKTSSRLITALGWGKDLKELRGDSVITFQLNAILILFRAERSGIDKTGLATISNSKEYLDYNQEVRDAIRELPDLEKSSVGKWSIVIREWILIFEKVPDDKKASFDIQGRAYGDIIGAIKDEWEKDTKEEMAERTKTHDEIEKKAVKNLSKHYNVKMKDGFPKEWDNLTGYEDFEKGKKWEDYAWVYHEYKKLKWQRQEALDGAEQAAKSKLLHDRIRKRLAEKVS